MPDKIFFITTPIYYINATPHIGHAYTQIAADARARFERLRGRHVYFLTGTDENAVKIARAAREQGRDPLQFCDELAQAFRDVWDALDISYDDYIRTTEERHKIVAQRVFAKLYESGCVRLGAYSGWYSVPDETFFRDEDTVERDGSHYIANPTEDQSKAPLEWVEEKTHFFELPKFSDALQQLYAERPEMLLPETRRNETLSYIRQGLRDTSISREMDWGIPVPDSVPEHENHAIYVWFEALINYASAPGYLSDDPQKREFFAQIWPPDLQLMSKDIFTRFHATLWPAVLTGLGLEQPKELFAHGFWTVDSRKMSKRDPETIVEPIQFARQLSSWSGGDFRVGVDALRYYVLREVTFGVDGDFSRAGCASRYNSDLANGLGNLVNRALSMLKQYFNSQVPAAPSEEGVSALQQAIAEAHPKIAQAYSELDFTGVLSQVWDVVYGGNRHIEEQKPWAKIKSGEVESVATLLRELLALCAWCSLVLMPVMPQSMTRLRDLLNLQNGPQWDEDIFASPLLQAGHVCQEPQPLFPRIPEPSIRELIAEQENKKVIHMENQNEQAPIQAAAPQTPNPSETINSEAVEAVDKETEKPAKETIEYADFAKVELRAAKILEAERVPKADKLLRLVVDIGTEKRQILAGIAQQFAPEEIIGKTIVVVANLAPRKLRGLESQGMLLAASPSDEAPAAGLVTIDADVPPGSIIR
ncbi:MAG TPA: methionine--tRNA ligase [Abditibacteriaceae bacterium]|jgi:methionyl-tRNA synthetase